MRYFNTKSQFLSYIQVVRWGIHFSALVNLLSERALYSYVFFSYFLCGSTILSRDCTNRKCFLFATLKKSFYSIVDSFSERMEKVH